MNCLAARGVQRVAVVVGFGLVLVSPVRAEREPAAGALDSRVRSIPYEADQVVRLQGQVGYALELQFEAGEAFVGLASGDLTGLDFTAQGEHLFLKPKAAAVTTNLTVLTDRRVYRFDYSIGPAGPAGGMFQRREKAVRSDPNVPPAGVPAAGVVWAVRFVYPKEGAAASGTVGMPAVLNERYQYCGARQIRPQRVFDDGVRTRLEFGVHQEIPAVFVQNPDGSESLVNFSVEGDALILHRIAEHFVLRRGSLVGCLWNRGPDPAHGGPTDRQVGGGS